MAVTSALVDNATRTGTTGTTSTVSSAAFGSAFAGRVLVDAVDSAGGVTPSSATIGGQSAVITNIAGFGTSLFSSLVASGTSGNIVANFPSSDTLNSWGIVALTGAASATPTDTISNASGGSGNIDVPAGGCVVAFSVGVGAGSWTGASAVRSDSTTTPGLVFTIATFDNSGGALTNRAVSYSTGVVLVAAAFDASGGGGSTYTLDATTGGTYSLSGQAVTLRQKPDWTLVGVSEAAVNASGNYTLTEPSGCQQDDILVVDFAVRSTVIYTNADWQFPQSDTGGNTTNNTTASDTSFQTGYCIRGASAPTLVFSRTGGSRALGTIRAYRSSVAGTPSFDTSASVAMTVAGTTVTLSGGITTAAANELLVTAVYGARANTVSNMDGTTEVTGNSGATDTTTAPVRGTWTERSDRNNGTSPTVALACYDTMKVTAGSTGNLTATESQSALHGMTVMAFKHPAGSNKTIAASGGSYSLTGAAVTTKRGRLVAASGGSYALSGSVVTLRRNLPIVASGGAYALNGTIALLLHRWLVPANGNSYSINGAPVTVRHGYSVTVVGGSYALNGANVSLLKAWKLPATGGIYALTGADVLITKFSNAVLSAGAGGYSLTGASAALLHTWKVAAQGSSYSVTGADVSLVLSNAPPANDLGPSLLRRRRRL